MQKKKTHYFSTASSLQQTGDRSYFNTKHYVCAFVTPRLLIPQATNRKYPSERVNLQAASPDVAGYVDADWRTCHRKLQAQFKNEVAGVTGPLREL